MHWNSGNVWGGDWAVIGTGYIETLWGYLANFCSLT